MAYLFKFILLNVDTIIILAFEVLKYAWFSSWYDF